MGICSYYLGPMDIPEADRSEYVRRALAMLRACGIVVGWSATPCSNMRR